MAFSFLFFLSSFFFGTIVIKAASSSCTVRDKIDVTILIQLNPPFEHNTTDDVKRFIRLNLEHFLIDLDYTRVAMIQFAPKPRIDWTFTDVVNRAEFEDSLNELDILVGGNGTVIDGLMFTVYHFWSVTFGARTDDPSVKKTLIAITNSPNIPRDQLSAIVKDFSATGTEVNIICINICWEVVEPPITVRRGIDGQKVDTSLARDLEKAFFCDPCYPDPCNGQGDCLTATNGSHLCVCRGPYLGANCEEPMFDSFCDANPGICNNDGFCVDGPRGSYNCECPENCHGFHCEECEDSLLEDYQACMPNPCQNGCFCVPSCRHADGYICQSSNGYFGKHCDIPLPRVDCGSEEIVITVSKAFVAEFDNGLNNTIVYVSPRTKPEMQNCKAFLIGDEYVTTIQVPFTSCSMETSVDEKDGVLVVSNAVWLGRETQKSLSTSVPAISFDCKYERNYAVVSSLNPEMDGMRLHIRSSGYFNASAQMCKSNEQCSKSCPERFLVHDRAIYTVGETIHIKMKVQKHFYTVSNRTTVILLDAKLACNDHEVSLVKRGCRTAVLPTTISMDKQVDSVCLSFQTPRMHGCETFFMKAILRIAENRHLQECDDGHGLEYVERETRRAQTHFKSQNAEHIEVGPIMIQNGRLSTNKSIRVLPGTPVSSDASWTPFSITAISFIISSLVLLSCLAVFFIATRKK
uniref:Uncharacterized protein LOC100179854 n=1 Tax=Phallusia mammillata TaxID=59560 RepID=A0A6F9DHV0_9ASCI|nr:uncharacterized protein LOC100179854 [Phallusia mammillata]